MSVNENKISKQLKNSMMNTMLSWFNRMAFEEITKKYKDCSDFEKLVMDIEKYYKNYKCMRVSNADSELMTRKLKEVQKRFEDLLTILDDNGNPIIMDNGDIETISYSPNALSICALDYLIHIERDIFLRARFGHIETSKALMEVEEIDKELYYNTVKIFNKLVDML